MRRSVRTLLVLPLAVGPVLAACGPPADSGETGSAATFLFRDAAERSGLTFEHDSGHEERFVFPEIMGGGVALFDMDHDGDLDVYCVQSGKVAAPGPAGENRLYRNDGRGRFSEVADSGAEHDGYGNGVAAGDYDNDGHIDLYVTNVGPNALLRNDGTGRFEDVTEQAGVGDDNWGTSCAFVDYDRDGDLDLYVCNYVHWSLEGDLRCYTGSGQHDYCNPTSYNSPEPDVLYQNNGDGTFTDVSVAAGMRSAFGNGLGVVCADFDDDGRIDMFVANDGMNNQLWLNQGDGKFLDRAMLVGCAVDKDGVAKAGMGTCAADIDGDDDLDLLVVNLQAQSDSFFRNEGRYFVDDAPLIGLGSATRSFTRFGVGWFDCDNDGDFDLFQANGRVTLPDRILYDENDPFAEPNVLLVGDGESFEPADASMFPRTFRTSRAAAFGDLNGDGAVDIVVINRDHRVELLENRHRGGNGWLITRAVNRMGRDDVGATLRFEVAGRTVRRDVNPHFSYQTSNDPRVHLGLGDARGVDAITVHWIDGTVERFPGQAANQVVELHQGQGTAVPDEG